ncbi:acyclic terpene utilization AtuA family protein [Humitalea sp. 24SJ18S-53]|uniref:acyclic terpene utilization AtuA family protein n=1 Tax=Humitalea sp. 24SJ18S-53 TaxID=3422307 RepID=UPI003D66B2C9
MPAQDEIRLLAATGCIGYGFTEVALEAAIARGVDVIAADAGSSDPGPYYLGAGKPFVSLRATERDLRLLLKAARRLNVPLIIGSAGGGGGTPHVALTRDIIERVAREEGLSFRLAVIDSEPSREFIMDKIRAGRTAPLGPIAELDEATVAGATRIVAMMGTAPLQAALDGGADVVLAGRCSDSALYATVPLSRGFDAGLAWHLGKTIECGGAIVRPKTGQDCVIGTLRADHFVIEPAHPDKRCTPESVASHTMYENPSPYEVLEPSGLVDTRASSYTALDDRRVRVEGSIFKPGQKYTVKLEGVTHCGHRAVFMAGVRDPVLIRQIKPFSDQIMERVRGEAISLGIDPASYTLTIRRYGLDAVLGACEPSTAEPHEIGLMLDVVAATPDDAATILAKARYAAMHTEFAGRLCTAGNLAVPFAPSDAQVGEAFRFSVWHIMELDDPLEIFPITYVDVKGR